MLKVSQLYVFPVKSLAGFPVQSAVVTDRGLQHDRRWMIVDNNNQFVTIRELPKMVLIQTKIEDNKLQLFTETDPIGVKIEIGKTIGEEIETTIWNATVKSYKVDNEVDKWLSEQLNAQVFLCYMPETSKRPVDTTSGFKPAGKLTSFADAYPFLVISEESLADLNTRTPEPVSMLQFRPNIVISGGEPYVEDNLENFTINKIPFTGLENCGRCPIPNVNPLTGIKNAENQPLKTLAKYRNVNKNIIFGRNTVHSETGVISVGDLLELN